MYMAPHYIRSSLFAEAVDNAREVGATSAVYMRVCVCLCIHMYTCINHVCNTVRNVTHVSVTHVTKLSNACVRNDVPNYSDACVRNACFQLWKQIVLN